MSPLLSSSFLPLSSVNSPSLAPGNTLHLAVLGLARQVLCTGAPHHRTSKLSPALGVAFLVPSAPDTFLSLDAVWPRQVCDCCPFCPSFGQTRCFHLSLGTRSVTPLSSRLAPRYGPVASCACRRPIE
ncbi:hypothetical protein K456DRAFT_30792 [Colletotrichum gloeosporioides 23]|nr:hypothetical protein K456DRAFT_30792 [Colletotrichum gloeosporioides 23]